MTISELFSYQEDIYPTQYQTSTKIVWIRQLEKEIYDYLSLFGEAAEREATANDDLLIDEPDLYATYISAMADFTNGEYARYNNKALLCRSFLDDWKSKYIRNHPPIGKKEIKI